MTNQQLASGIKIKKQIDDLSESISKIDNKLSRQEIDGKTPHPTGLYSFIITGGSGTDWSDTEIHLSDFLIQHTTLRFIRGLLVAKIRALENELSLL